MHFTRERSSGETPRLTTLPGGIMMHSCIEKKSVKLQGSTTAEKSDDSVNVTCRMHRDTFGPNLDS